MNIVRNKKNIAFLVLLLGAMVTVVGCNTGDTDGAVVSKTDTSATTEVAEEANTNNSVEVAVNTNEAATSEVVSTETNNTEETTSEEQSDIPEDWVKYENEEYGFSFYYPKDWSVEESINNVPVEALNSISISNNSNEYKLFNSVNINVVDQNLIQLENAIRKIEDIDRLEDGTTLSKVYFEDVVLGDSSLKRGYYNTAIGIPVEFYYQQISDDKSLYVSFNKYSDVRLERARDIIETIYFD